MNYELLQWTVYDQNRYQYLLRFAACETVFTQVELIHIEFHEHLNKYLVWVAREEVSFKLPEIKLLKNRKSVLQVWWTKKCN